MTTKSGSATNQQKVEHYDKVIKSYYDLIETYRVAGLKMRNERNESENSELVNLDIENCVQMMVRLERDVVRLREERARYFY